MARIRKLRKGHKGTKKHHKKKSGNRIGKVARYWFIIVYIYKYIYIYIY